MALAFVVNLRHEWYVPEGQHGALSPPGTILKKNACGCIMFDDVAVDPRAFEKEAGMRVSKHTWNIVLDALSNDFSSDHSEKVALLDGIEWLPLEPWQARNICTRADVAPTTKRRSVPGN